MVSTDTVLLNIKVSTLLTLILIYGTILSPILYILQLIPELSITQQQYMSLLMNRTILDVLFTLILYSYLYSNIIITFKIYPSFMIVISLIPSYIIIYYWYIHCSKGLRFNCIAVYGLVLLILTSSPGFFELIGA